MKILSVGDLHGKSIWEKIDASQYDRVRFIGDLYDAPEYNLDEIHDNVLALVQWARNAGNVDFVIGNHDAHYFKWLEPVFREIRGTGFNEKQLYRAYHLYIENKDLFRVAYQEENYLWTHAGLSQSYYGFHIQPQVLDIMKTYSVSTLAEVLNIMWDINYSPLFVAPLSRGGNDVYGGPLWASQSDTIGDPLAGYHQIVGHTGITDIKHVQINLDTSITYIDCLNYSIGKFYELEL